jgi:hypothetical protein
MASRRDFIKTTLGGAASLAAIGRLPVVTAAALSRAARTVFTRRVELAPVTPVTGTWMTPARRDPFRHLDR